MKQALEEKYDHLTMTTTGIAMGVEDCPTTDEDKDTFSEYSEDQHTRGNSRSASPLPRSPMAPRKRYDSIENKAAGGGLSIPVMNLGRRGSMLVQTYVKTPEWNAPDQKADKIDWSTRGKHYPVHTNSGH